MVDAFGAWQQEQLAKQLIDGAKPALLENLGEWRLLHADTPVVGLVLA